MQSRFSFLLNSFDSLYIFRGEGKGAFYALVNDDTHFRSPSFPMLGIFQPLFGGALGYEF